MFNQEQLAAIAAAVSILRQSMQSNGSPSQNGSPASLPVERELLLQHLGMAPGHQAAATVTPTTTPITSTSRTSPFIDQLRLQYNRSDLSNQLINQQPLSNNSYSTTTNLQLDEIKQQQQQQQQQAPTKSQVSTLAEPSRPISYSAILRNALSNQPAYGRATNLLGFMGLYVGNLSQDLSKEQLEKIFSKYGEPVKAHRLIRSPVAFIKYENTESPRAAIDDLYGVLLPELTLNPDQPLKLHFDRNDAQLKANYRPTELPKEDNGECYGWRTTVCKRGKSCPKKHIPINRGIDFQMWMIKSNANSNSSVITTSAVTPTLTS